MDIFTSRNSILWDQKRRDESTNHDEFVKEVTEFCGDVKTGPPHKLSMLLSVFERE
jgi:hypothetical protein